MDKLFSNYTLKGHTIRNRVVMPAMEFLVRQTRRGFVTDDHVRHYGLRAKGGIGLVIVEATSIHPSSMSIDSQLGAWSDDHVPGLAKLANECHTHGAKVLLQLHHLGVKMHGNPLGPSAYRGATAQAREMTISELHSLQEAFVDAALRAHQAGFDGVEFHGADGSLLNQFSSPMVNRRCDTYGGNVQHRMQFAREIVGQIRALTSHDFILSYRMGCNDPTLEQSIAMGISLESMGIDMIHVSSSGYFVNQPQLPKNFNYHWIVYGGSQIKERVSIPVIAACDIRTPERANDILEKKLADFASIGRELIVDPNWANKAKNDESIRYCMRCKPCVVFSGQRCVML